ncbi:MAG: hypothetical protein WA893_08870, partial [Xanthobacteraceae bacterium]
RSAVAIVERFGSNGNDQCRAEERRKNHNLSLTRPRSSHSGAGYCRSIHNSARDLAFPGSNPWFQTAGML